MFTIHSSEKVKEAALPRFGRLRTESGPMTPSVFLYESKERLRKQILSRAYGTPSRNCFNGTPAFPAYTTPSEQKVMPNAGGEAILRLVVTVLPLFVGMVIGMWLFSQIGMDLGIGGALGAVVGFFVAAFSSKD